jgi:hypothetical protein
MLLYRRALMKIVRLFTVLLLIAMSACSTAHKEIVVKQDILPGWELGYEHLGILSVALDHKDEAREYALHSVGDSMLTANIIVKTWQFSWEGSECEVAESDYYTKAEIEGIDPVYYKVLNYAIYSEDGKFIMELEKSESSEGEVQFLIRSEGDGLVVDLFRSGEITRKAYDDLPAKYGCSNSKISSLAHREEFSYCVFGVDAMDLAIVRNKAMRENGILKVISKEVGGARTEMHLNQEFQVIYMSSEGLEFEKCDVNTALVERRGISSRTKVI